MWCLLRLMNRSVQDEWLDEMDANDPAAVRSRRDLRLINAMMGGERWIMKQLRDHLNITHCIEIGAGEGGLSGRIKAVFPDMKVSALDRIERPNGLSEEVEWFQSDVFDIENVVKLDDSVVVVANLFVHHFDQDLERLFTILKEAGIILLAEPYRSKGAKFLGKLIYPMINHVTKHDMMISIEAGFVEGELTSLLGDQWVCEEKKSLLGGLRLKGVKK